MDLLSDLAGKSPEIRVRLNSTISRTVDLSASKTLNTLGTWLDAHRDHPLYDQTTHAFALRTRADDPEAALRWAATIQDELLRRKTQAVLGGPQGGSAP